VGIDDLTVVCAWCATAVHTGDGARTSHGICADCAMDFLARLPLDYLKSIAEPDGTVSLFSGLRIPLSLRAGDA
jgi:hypothetical protein